MEVQGAGTVVTGGASGLGRATAERLAALGARVVVVDLPASRGAEVAAGLGAGARFLAADVTDGDALEAAVASAAEPDGLRVLVACAGIGPPAAVVGRDGAPMPLAHFRRLVDVNLVGTFNAVRLAAAHMAGNAPNADGERGVIVITASIAAFDGQVNQVAYAASKAGVAGMTLPLARELGRLGIRVVAIAPGTFDTPPIGRIDPAVLGNLVSALPFPRRLGRPPEFAATVAHILENPMLNGETIRLDAAMRLR